MPAPAKDSLKAMGFRIEPIKRKSDNEKGFLYKVTGDPPVYYIKRTRSGKLLAFRNKADKVETTINGLYKFEDINGELVGERWLPKPIAQRPVTPATPKAA